MNPGEGKPAGVGLGPGFARLRPLIFPDLHNPWILGAICALDMEGPHPSKTAQAGRPLPNSAVHFGGVPEERLRGLVSHG